MSKQIRLKIIKVRVTKFQYLDLFLESDNIDLHFNLLIKKTRELQFCGVAAFFKYALKHT